MQIGCLDLYYEFLKKNVMTVRQPLFTGDVVEITNEGMFVSGTGWFVVVLINDGNAVYVHTDQLEMMMSSNILYPLAELESELSLLYFKLNQALDSRNELLFLELAAKWKSLQF